MIAAVLLIPLLAAAPDPVGQYLGDLERAGIVHAKEASLDGLREGLVAA